MVTSIAMNPMIMLLCFFISFSCIWTCHGTAVLIGNTLRPGEALNSSSFLVSASEEYTLGFNSGYLTVRSKNYTVWVANLDRPISDPSKAHLTLTVNETITVVQITPKGEDPIVLYSSGSSYYSTNVVATLSNSGNFVLHEVQGSNSMQVLWQSLDDYGMAHSGIVALPMEMKLRVDGQGFGRKIWSWQDSPNSPGPGLFTLEWNINTGQLEVSRSEILLWTSGRLRGGKFEHINIPDEFKVRYNFNVVSNENEDSFSYTAVGDQNVRSVWVLGTDGELYDVNYNISIARAGDCDGYNKLQGCQRWYSRTDCPAIPFAADFQPIDYSSFKSTSRDSSLNSTCNWLMDTNFTELSLDKSFAVCHATCWKDCDCLGFDLLIDNQTTCRFWSAKYALILEDPHSSATIFIIPGSTITKISDASHKWIWIGLAVAAVFLGMGLCSVYYLIQRSKFAGENQTKIQDMLNMMKSNRPTDANGLQNDGKRGHDLSVFKYASIMAATRNFSDENKLGEGGFGPVYKGKLMTGQEVAVKRLSKCSGQGMSEFKNELILIYELQHTNLVQLFGFCIHGEERMLIYEYMPNKSLDYFLFDSTRCQKLDWNKRFNIIEGIAQGLLYLHKYSRLRVIHRDLKASNVLLDENMNPKISDFGLARIFAHNEQEANTMKIVGTRGYMPPEYVIGGKFSMKSDVSSFGVLMLEILSGRKNNSFYKDDPFLNIVGYAWTLWKQGAGLRLMDPILDDSCDKDKLVRCIHVGLLCVEENAASRPEMLDVISALSNIESMSLPIPTKPAFFTEKNVPSTAAGGGNGPENVASVNGISVSDFDGR